jgi:hypothetical protein
MSTEQIIVSALSMPAIEIRYISRRRAEYLMGALGLLGGTLISGIGIERRMVVQPVGADIADGAVVDTAQCLSVMRRAEQFFGDCGADLAAFRAARDRIDSQGGAL